MLANQRENGNVVIPPELYAKLSSSYQTKGDSQGRDYQTEARDVYQLNLMTVVVPLLGEDHDVAEMSETRVQKWIERQAGRQVGSGGQ